MKSYTIIIAMLISANSLFAQTNYIFGDFTKADGSKINGASVAMGYQGQLIISNYTGGTDNTATIEIEVPTGGYVADFRNMMNASSTIKQPVVNAQKVNANINPNSLTNLNVPKTAIISPAQPTVFPSITISVCKRGNDERSYYLQNKIILQNVVIESCTDNGSTGKTLIKIRGARIGWFYNTYDPRSQKVSSSNKSGWDTITGQAWNNF
ncbi:MAG: hypothetical protein V4541_08160 [Bacteroidota bacterium]